MKQFKLNISCFTYIYIIIGVKPKVLRMTDGLKRRQTYDPKHKWSLRDRLTHEKIKKIDDQKSNKTFRENLLESQKKVNYVNEFDRLKGHLYANRSLPAPTKTHLENRMKQLQDLAKESMYGKDHLYKDDVDDYKKDGV